MQGASARRRTVNRRNQLFTELAPAPEPLPRSPESRVPEALALLALVAS